MHEARWRKGTPGRRHDGDGPFPLWGAPWSFACAAIAAAPGVHGLSDVARLVVAAVVLHRHWLPLWSSIPHHGPNHQSAGRIVGRSATELGASVMSLAVMAALLVLIGTGGQVWLALAVAILALERGLSRLVVGAGMVVGLLGAMARMLLPGYLAWLAIRGWQPLAPDVAQAISVWGELTAGFSADAAFLLPWLAFTAVAWAMDDLAGLHGDTLRRLVWAGGYGLASLFLASIGAWLAAGGVLMLAAAQGPLLGALNHRRLGWFRQAVQPFGLLALLVVAGSVALRG